jgi:muramoyltetrapeptide carboxypeptidase
LLPRPLRPGDRVALVAPSSPFDDEPHARACEQLRAHGYEPVTGKSAAKRAGYLAGSDCERAEDLMAAILDARVAAVICIRGGYGSSRIIPWLPFSALAPHVKVFLGYSDITFLHLTFWKMMRWVTFHGPNLVDLNGEAAVGLEEILRTLSGEREFHWTFSRHQVLRDGVASGVLLGGNLTCLSHLLMTNYLPDLEGALLFIEDCREALYRLDRLLTHVRLAGILERINGLVVGRFQECGEELEVRALIEERTQPFAFPVVSGLPFGHGTRNDPLPLGLPYLLNTHEGTLAPRQDVFAR